MKQYKKYLIGKNDQFEPDKFNFINEEVERINYETRALPSLYKAELIISFLKEQLNEADGANTNPQLTALLLSGNFSKGNLWHLFKSCSDAPGFQKGMELFLKKEIC